MPIVEMYSKDFLITFPGTDGKMMQYLRRVKITLLFILQYW